MQPQLCASHYEIIFILRWPSTHRILQLYTSICRTLFTNIATSDIYIPFERFAFMIKRPESCSAASLVIQFLPNQALSGILILSHPYWLVFNCTNVPAEIYTHCSHFKPDYEFDLSLEEDLLSLNEIQHAPSGLECLLQDLVSLHLALSQEDSESLVQAEWLALCSKLDCFLFRFYLLVLASYAGTLLMLWTIWNYAWPHDQRLNGYIWIL